MWRWCPCHSDGASRRARGSFLVRVHDEAWGYARCLAHESGETGRHVAYAPLQPFDCSLARAHRSSSLKPGSIAVTMYDIF